MENTSSVKVTDGALKPSVKMRLNGIKRLANRNSQYSADHDLKHNDYHQTFQDRPVHFNVLEESFSRNSSSTRHDVS